MKYPKLTQEEIDKYKLTLEERKIVDELAMSISKLLHIVVAKRLGQFFEVIKADMARQMKEKHDER